MAKIERAIISVTDKSGILDFACARTAICGASLSRPRSSRLSLSIPLTVYGRMDVSSYWATICR